MKRIGCYKTEDRELLWTKNQISFGITVIYGEPYFTYISGDDENDIYKRLKAINYFNEDMKRVAKKLLNLWKKSEHIL